jgi:Ca2+-binding EF-hand superfamily protein
MAIEQLNQAFDIFDEDRSGKISKEELVRAMLKYGEPITDSQAEEMVAEADKDGDGELDREEILSVLVTR